MKRKGFFKSLAIGAGAIFWENKLKALEAIPVPKEEPEFKWEEPAPKWNQMTWKQLQLGDVIILWPKVVGGVLLGKQFYITNNYAPFRFTTYSLIGKSMTMPKGKDDYEYIDITKLETGSFGKICSTFQER